MAPHIDIEKVNKGFEIYYSLKSERSYEKVAQALSVSVATVQKWSKKYKWRERVLEKEHNEYLMRQREIDLQILQDKKTYRGILKKSVNVFVDKLNRGDVKIDTVKDLVMLINCDLGIMEQLDKHTADEFTCADSVSPETSETLSKIAQALDNIDEPEDEEEDA